MKRIILMMIAVAMLTGLFSACTAQDPNTEDLNGGNSVSSSEATDSQGTKQEETESDSEYQPGQWTENGYTSQWLNLSFSKGNKFKTTKESIEITKQFNKAKKQNDPYAGIIEMEFSWVEGNGTPIMLVVEPLKDKTMSVEEYMDQVNKENQNSYDKYKIEVVERSEKEITFLEDTYLQCYEKTMSFGKTFETYMLCKIKDDHIVRIQFYAEESRMDIETFLSCFSTLNEPEQ